MLAKLLQAVTLAALSGAAAGLLPESLGWQLPWLVLGAVAGAMAIGAWPALNGSGHRPPAPPASPPEAARSLTVARCGVSSGLAAGVGAA